MHCTRCVVRAVGEWSVGGQVSSGGSLARQLVVLTCVPLNGACSSAHHPTLHPLSLPTLCVPSVTFLSLCCVLSVQIHPPPPQLQGTVPQPHCRRTVDPPRSRRCMWSQPARSLGTAAVHCSTCVGQPVYLTHVTRATHPRRCRATAGCGCHDHSHGPTPVRRDAHGIAVVCCFKPAPGCVWIGGWGGVWV